MKRMLINATQPEECRLAVVDGQKLLDYEIEVAGREHRKGNIYKAVVTRVEPSLEACFVDYGEERHGFLPFKEISRQYFQGDTPVSQARIEDVIKEGQELLVQVEKEERGNKGAALTTFVSLAGRYVVLMPNNSRGGGVSRRIDGDDRAKLKAALSELDYPKGMSIIARTAGIGRTTPQLQWDLNYLLKLWDAIDGAARDGKGAFLIYQESNLVIRAIRDYFHDDIGDILIDTDDVHEQAFQFMSHVMPEHASKVKRYRDDAPLFSRFQIEHQIESAYSRTVILPSGGSIVIDRAEALVAIDVNSARAIRGGDIEETATQTNLEAADEVARQLRLRDLGGLIVIDFIDMDESGNRREVENRLRDALREDRARVQFGAISKFGLMEMSRQRLKPALSEGASILCPRCGGAGHVRDTESSALQILRIIQEEAMKDNTAAVNAQVPVDVASFLLNEKRAEITKIEVKQRVNVTLIPNKTLETPHYKLERLKYDDTRLDNPEASYKLADEEDDETTVTRRSNEPTNRQKPVIKGVIRDTPAPQPEPEAVPPASNAQAQAAAAAVAPAAKAVGEAVAAVGLVGWLKSLFNGFAQQPTSAPVPQPARAPQPAPAAEPTATESSESEGNDRRRGARSGGRGGRNRGNGHAGGNNGNRRRSDSERSGDARSGNDEAQATHDNADRGNHDESGDSNGSSGSNGRRRRGGRGGSRNRNGSRRNQRRSDNADVQDPSDDGGDAQRQNGSDDTTSASEDGGERRGRSRGNGHRERRQRNRDDRGNYGEREDRRAQRDRDAYDHDADHDGEEATDVAIAQHAPTSDVVPEETPRSYFERGNAADENTDAAIAAPVPADVDAAADESVTAAKANAREPQADTRGARERAPASAHRKDADHAASAKATAQPDATGTAVAAAAPAKPYILPTENLTQVTESAGLQWVHSDADKVAAAQAAIQAEPKPVHVPREPRPAPVIDEGGLILVETTRNLNDVTLPFEHEAH